MCTRICICRCRRICRFIGVCICLSIPVCMFFTICATIKHEPIYGPAHITLNMHIRICMHIKREISYKYKQAHTGI